LPLIPTTRRRFLRGAVATCAAAIAGDAVLVDPNRPRIVRQEFFLPRWPEEMDSFTVAILSDFHYDPYFSAHPLRAAIPMVNSLHPDLIVLRETSSPCPKSGRKKEAQTTPNPALSYSVN